MCRISQTIRGRQHGTGSSASESGDDNDNLIPPSQSFTMHTLTLVTIQQQKWSFISDVNTMTSSYFQRPSPQGLLFSRFQATYSLGGHTTALKQSFTCGPSWSGVGYHQQLLLEDHRPGLPPSGCCSDDGLWTVELYNVQLLVPECSALDRDVGTSLRTDSLVWRRLVGKHAGTFHHWLV